MQPADRYHVAELIHVSINHWYKVHGRGRAFGAPLVTDVFYDVYTKLDGPDAAIVVENVATGTLAGSCFYHPRPHHISLGILNVHPNYFGTGAGKLLVQWGIDWAKRENKPLRLTQSAINLDSFSLYNKMGFVPRHVFQDMTVRVPAEGLPFRTAGDDRVRPAKLSDVPAMVALEMEVSGISREVDCRYCIENADGFWHVAVFESSGGRVEGWMISSNHPGANWVGPCVARNEEVAAALILRELDHHRGRSPIFLVPCECAGLVRKVYDWGGRNTELHLCQVYGDFQPFRGISMPVFMPETS
jgi:GNAT superfamily N-acetyltransferase